MSVDKLSPVQQPTPPSTEQIVITPQILTNTISEAVVGKPDPNAPKVTPEKIGQALGLVPPEGSKPKIVVTPTAILDVFKGNLKRKRG